ncbi:hypothetical protein ABTE57_19235, partial [Acinetobacter baumannii]
AATLEKTSSPGADTGAAKTNDAAGESSGSSANSKITLASVSLTDFGKHSTADTGSTHLPGLKVEDDKAVQAERAKLLELAHSKLGVGEKAAR